MSCFNEEMLNDFDEGKLSDHQIKMMLINAIKNLESRVENLESSVHTLYKKQDPLSKLRQAEVTNNI